MKVISGHSPAFFSHFSFSKKYLPGFVLFLFFPFAVAAQDSLQLRSFKDCPNTFAINESYKPSLSPQLLWKLSYPLTAEQIRQRDEDQRRKEDLGSQAIDAYFKRSTVEKNLNR